MSSALIPSLRYKDAQAAIAWLERAFGMVRHAVYDGPDGTVAHAELTFGSGMIMLGSAQNPGPNTQYYALPQEIGGRITSPLYLVSADCESLWQSAKSVGAEVVMELKEMEYGGKAFTVRDPEGYLWSVGEYDPGILPTKRPEANEGAALATNKFPYEEALGDRDPVKVMSKTPRKLMRLLDDLDDDQIEQRPAPGKWNLREIISHLADCELVWAWRLRYVYGEKEPVIQPFDQDNWAKAYKSYSLAEALGAFKSMRKWNLAFINGLKSADCKKVVVHPERGEETMWTLVQIAAGHDLHHLALLEKQLSQKYKD